MERRPRIPKSLIQWHVNQDKSKVKPGLSVKGWVIHQLTRAVLMTDKGTFPIGRFILNFEADNPFGPEYQHDLATWKANSAGLAWNPNVPFQEFNTQLYDLCESWWMMMPKYYDKLQVHENCPLWLDYVKLHNELIRYLEAREFYTQDFTSPLMMDML